MGFPQSSVSDRFTRSGWIHLPQIVLDKSWKHSINNTSPCFPLDPQILHLHIFLPLVVRLRILRAIYAAYRTNHFTVLLSTQNGKFICFQVVLFTITAFKKHRFPYSIATQRGVPSQLGLILLRHTFYRICFRLQFPTRIYRHYLYLM